MMLSNNNKFSFLFLEHPLVLQCMLNINGLTVFMKSSYTMSISVSNNVAVYRNYYFPHDIADTPVTDDFIDVHIALSSGASLPHDQREMIVQFPLVHLRRS